MNGVTESLSESMEMYLVTVARLQKGSQPVPLSALAESLNVTTVSVNEMCRKLQSTGFLSYKPYKGAALTQKGKEIANQTLRRHRLWEVFLVKKLQMTVGEADDVACELEHVSPEYLINRLDAYLGYPNYNPRGLPIPKLTEEEEIIPDIPLKDLVIGRSATIKHCQGPESLTEFLAGQGIRKGTKVTPVAAGQENLLIEVDGVHITLYCAVAGKIMVSPDLLEVDQGHENSQLKIMDPNTLKGSHMPESEVVATKQIPLSELEKGVDAVIVSVGGKGAIKRRMMDMGIVPGSEINVIRAAPFGDPIEYSIKGYSLSLRKAEAKEIIVEILED
jgi:DtxR family transcriptional regulator, Mn-dependent transcriptional regulator